MHQTHSNEEPAVQHDTITASTTRPHQRGCVHSERLLAVLQVAFISTPLIRIRIPNLIIATRSTAQHRVRAEQSGEHTGHVGYTTSSSSNSKRGSHPSNPTLQALQEVIEEADNEEDNEDQDYDGDYDPRNMVRGSVAAGATALSVIDEVSSYLMVSIVP